MRPERVMQTFVGLLIMIGIFMGYGPIWEVMKWMTHVMRHLFGDREQAKRLFSKLLFVGNARMRVMIVK